MNSPKAWPRQPFIGIALAAIGGIISADWRPHLALGLSLVVFSAAVAVFRKGSATTYLFVACCFFSLHSFRQVASPGVRLARELGAEPVAIAARGEVVTDPRVSSQGTASFLFQLNAVEQHGERHPCEATISAHWRGDVQFGDELQLFGVIAPTTPPRNPGEFDMRAYSARRDIYQELVLRYPENGKMLSRGGGSRVLRAAHASRRWMQATLGRGLEDSSDLHALISSMVLGASGDTPDDIEEQFQQTGTLHLFAVSGLNVAIIAQLLWTIASAARVPRKLAIVLIIAALFFYAAVTGLNSSSVRAAIMASVFLLAFFVDREVHLGNTVAAAALAVLCWDTNQFFSTGFQLSFAVVIVILLLANRLLAWLTGWTEPDAFLPKILLRPQQRLWRAGWHLIAAGAAVSLAAWIGSLPLIFPYFYLITPVSLFANLVVVPLAFLALAFGLMSLLVAPVAGWLALVFNNANWTVAAAILGSVGLFARAPAGHFYLELPRWPDGARAELTALDLGAGAAIHVRDRESDWLVDCGAERDFKRIVRGYLRSRGINRIDGLLLTHGDAMHIGATSSTMRAFHPRELIDSAAPDRSRAHKELLDFFVERHVPPAIFAAPQTFPLGHEIEAQILFPPEEFRGATADDQAFVVRLTIGDRWHVLLMSDSGDATEKALLQSDVDLRSEVVIKGQHHSGDSCSPEFLERVQPQLIIASSIEFPENEHIKDDWAAMIDARGIRLLRQDRTGAVALRFFRERWEARSYLTGETFRAPSR